MIATLSLCFWSSGFNSSNAFNEILFTSSSIFFEEWFPRASSEKESWFCRMSSCCAGGKQWPWALHSFQWQVHRRDSSGLVKGFHLYCGTAQSFLKELESDRFAMPKHICNECGCRIVCVCGGVVQCKGQLGGHGRGKACLTNSSTAVDSPLHLCPPAVSPCSFK